jgi:hypothetical protein
VCIKRLRLWQSLRNSNTGLQSTQPVSQKRRLVKRAHERKFNDGQRKSKGDANVEVERERGKPAREKELEVDPTVQVTNT